MIPSRCCCGGELFGLALTLVQYVPGVACKVVHPRLLHDLLWILVQVVNSNLFDDVIFIFFSRFGNRVARVLCARRAFWRLFDLSDTKSTYCK